jgi:hypothetical protein
MPGDKMFGHISFIMILITVAAAAFLITGHMLDDMDAGDSESALSAYGYSVDVPQDDAPATGDAEVPQSPEVPYTTRPVKIEDNDWCKEGGRVLIYTEPGKEHKRWEYLEQLTVTVAGLYLIRGEELCMAKIVPNAASGIEYILFITRGDYLLELLGRKSERVHDKPFLRYIMNDKYEIVNVALPPDSTVRVVY